MSAAAELYGLDPSSRVVLAALPVAIYTTDADGRITFYNEAAVRLWGREPVLNKERWCAAAKLHGAEEVAGLIIAHAIPQRSAASFQIVDGKYRRFRFQ